MRESFFTAEDGDILSITVSSNRSKLNGNTVNLTLTSPAGQRQNIVFNESSTQEYVELYEGVWAFTFNGYFDRIVLNNIRKSVNDIAGSIPNEN